MYITEHQPTQSEIPSLKIIRIQLEVFTIDEILTQKAKAMWQYSYEESREVCPIERMMANRRWDEEWVGKSWAMGVLSGRQEWELRVFYHMVTW